MAQTKYRGNLSAKVFPFLSSQFGRSVIVANADQASTTQYSGEASGGDSNIPQAYYMHNVIPTSQGYKSVGYKQIIPPNGVKFDKVLPVRDPGMMRGWIGITAQGNIYIYRAGDSYWSPLGNFVDGWAGGEVSVAVANGTTYICLSKFRIYKLNLTERKLLDVDLIGIEEAGVVAITSSSNYLIITDGVTIYWSSTISPEDFTPSLVTGAGSGKPTDLEGRVVAMVPTTTGFAIYSEVNVVVALYSQNPRFPWIFKVATNSKGVSGYKDITASAEDGNTYAWTSAGVQRISSVGAVSIMAEVTDFLTGLEIEDFDSVTNTIKSQDLDSLPNVRLTFVGARYLVVSYGDVDYRFALLYDTALKRWGKLKYNHVACFEVTLNTSGPLPSNAAAAAKKTLGFISPEGEVVICNFDNNAEALDSVLVLGKFQLTRSRLVTLDSVSIETVDKDSDNFEVIAVNTLDGKTPDRAVKLTPSYVASQCREYPTRLTGVNISLVLKGRFSLNSFELAMHLNGRR